MDLIPILKRIPERFAPWKAQARHVRDLQRKLYFGLLDECEKRVASGNENGCFMEEVLAKREELELDHELVGYVHFRYFSYVMLIHCSDILAVYSLKQARTLDHLGFNRLFSPS